MERIHIGEAIRAELQRQERGVSWFARQLPCDRSTVYRLLASEHLDTELLLRICCLLRHDFFADLSAVYRTSEPVWEISQQKCRESCDTSAADLP